MLPPDEPTDEERQEELPEDNGTPFQAADPQRDDTVEPDSTAQLNDSTIDDTHPITDTDLDTTEQYQEGVESAALGDNQHQPRQDSGVTDFNPPEEDPTGHS